MSGIPKAGIVPPVARRARGWCRGRCWGPAAARLVEAWGDAMAAICRAWRHNLRRRDWKAAGCGARASDATGALCRLRRREQRPVSGLQRLEIRPEGRGDQGCGRTGQSGGWGLRPSALRLFAFMSPARQPARGMPQFALAASSPGTKNRLDPLRSRLSSAISRSRPRLARSSATGSSSRSFSM
jgi:hypothetical protein